MSTFILELSDTQLYKLERLAQQRGMSLDALVREVLDALVLCQISIDGVVIQ